LPFQRLKTLNPTVLFKVLDIWKLDTSWAQTVSPKCVYRYRYSWAIHLV